MSLFEGAVEVAAFLERQQIPYAVIRKWLRAFAPIIEGHDVGKLFESALRKARRALKS